MKCAKCKQEVTHAIRNSTTVNKAGEEKIRWWCNPCNSARTKAYYQRNKEKFREMIYKSIAKHKYKQDARQAVKRAIIRGDIVKPTSCEDCHQVKKLHGHHEDYSKPLEVNWLCATCHSDRHAEHRHPVTA